MDFFGFAVSTQTACGWAPYSRHQRKLCSSLGRTSAPGTPAAACQAQELECFRAKSSRGGGGGVRHLSILFFFFSTAPRRNHQSHSSNVNQFQWLAHCGGVNGGKRLMWKSQRMGEGAAGYLHKAALDRLRLQPIQQPLELRGPPSHVRRAAHFEDWDIQVDFKKRRKNNES